MPSRGSAWDLCKSGAIAGALWADDVLCGWGGHGGLLGRDRVVTAAGGLPAEVTANWRTLGIGTVDVEFGFSCMGYEIAGGWGARIAQGNDILHKHAIVGFTGAAGMMPARGGNPSLSDEQVIATVDWMLANLK